MCPSATSRSRSQTFDSPLYAFCFGCAVGSVAVYWLQVVVYEIQSLNRPRIRSIHLGLTYVLCPSRKFEFLSVEISVFLILSSYSFVIP